MGGEKPLVTRLYALAEDHPRMGGEKEARDYPKEEVWGSPPHGRGKGGKLPGRVRPQGITPAWAGKRTTEL